MLVHYLLHRWEAIELVCKAISKYEAEKEAEEVEAKGAKAKYRREFTLEEFKENSAIIDALRKYSSKDRCYEFTDKVFSGTNRQLLYNLVLWIKSSRPIVLSETELTALLKYVGERGTLDRYHNIMPQEFSTTQRAFEGTKWWLYNFDDYEDESGQVVEGITRALVTLNAFAKAEITNYSSVDRKTEVYKCKYEIYEDKYLRLELTISGTFGKDLTILVYVGKNDPKEIDLVLGLYHNIDEEHMYTGTVILQRIPSPGDTKLEPKFVNKDNPDDRKLIDEKVWTYLINKSQNRIRVKPGIITMDKFSVWLHRQSKKRKERGQQGEAGLASQT